MQTNLFSKEQIDQESSVGEFFKGQLDYDPNLKIYFEYPGVKEIYKNAKQALLQNKKVTFRCKKPIDNYNFTSKDFLQSDFQQKNKHQSFGSYSGLMTSLYASPFTQAILGQKILGNYSIAYIEALASKYFHESCYQSSMIDHFYSAQGICNLELFSDFVRALEIKKNSLVCFLLPANSIRAFRKDRYTSWQTPVTKSFFPEKAKAELLNKNTKEKIAQINLVDNKITNLDFPLYKVKIEDRWVILVPWQNQLESLEQNIHLSVTNELINNQKNSTEAKNCQNVEEEIIEASLGQASRVIFELFEGNYDNLPEVILNFEGGSWSSIAFENCSSSRHQGINSMHEVLNNKWYEHEQIAIPWNYLGFDKYDSSKEGLLVDENIYLLKFADEYFLEANQSWKKITNEISKYVIKFVYREFLAIASKKYLLSTKEIMHIVTRFLAKLAYYDFESYDKNFIAELKKENISDELIGFLRIIHYAHSLLSTRADFNSFKTNPHNIERLSNLAKIQKYLEKNCPITVRNFKQKINDLLQKDIKTEQTTLWQLYTAAINHL